MASADFRRQIEGYGLTTANILYRMPDHPEICKISFGSSTTCILIFLS